MRFLWIRENFGWMKKREWSHMWMVWKSVGDLIEMVNNFLYKKNFSSIGMFFIFYWSNTLTKALALDVIWSRFNGGNELAFVELRSVYDRGLLRYWIWIWMWIWIWIWIWIWFFFLYLFPLSLPSRPNFGAIEFTRNVIFFGAINCYSSDAKALKKSSFLKG